MQLEFPISCPRLVHIYKVTLLYQQRGPSLVMINDSFIMLLIPRPGSVLHIYICDMVPKLWLARPFLP